MPMSVGALRRSRALWRRRRDAAERSLNKAAAMILRRDRQIRTATSGASGTIRWALARVGTTESPAGSNGGPKIDAWQRRFGISRAPWCGAFVGAALEAGGRVDVTNRIVYTPWIVEDAKARRNGFAAWDTGDHAKAGDLVLFDFDGGLVDHVGLVVKDHDGSGFLVTVEGNTSSGNRGSQDNGGGVFVRRRPLSQVRGVARPKW